MGTTADTARELLKEFKGDKYVFGIGVVEQLADRVALMGKRVSLVADGIGQDWAQPFLYEVLKNLKAKGILLAGDPIKGARPNSPCEDLLYITNQIEIQQPDLVISIGGGSTIDATKTAIAFRVLRDKYPDIYDYFGTGQISNMLNTENRKLIPHLAVMMAASSAAHLTKYSNITDIGTGQKMLIVDNAIIPDNALFDYSVTITQPVSLTVDGALDGISHALEVLMGIPETQLDKAKHICLTGMSMIVNNLKNVISNPKDLKAREAIGLGTDLGGYAIMVGGTNGAHLNSFSMTDILSHGRTCALMNPYYVVFFSPVIENRLREAGLVFARAGYINDDLDKLKGRSLGLAIAKGMMLLSKEIGFPTTLCEVPGFTDLHIQRCLNAAKNPKLESKLKNMPVPLVASQVDEYMGSVLMAAKNGNMSLIKIFQ